MEQLTYCVHALAGHVRLHLRVLPVAAAPFGVKRPVAGRGVGDATRVAVECGDSGEESAFCRAHTSHAQVHGARVGQHSTAGAV